MFMPTTVDEIYTQMIQALPPDDRLRLATLILNNLVPQEVVTIDDSDTWTATDITDLSKFSLQYAATADLDEAEVI
jgi:hypothetical protein